jgi:gliding motility-associatede transport system auxiliary component
MPAPSQPSFSPRRRWKIGVDLLVRTALALAVVVMANYLGAQFFKRLYLSSQTRVHLSSRTLSVLQSLTNRVNVTLYYDKSDDFYSDIVELLNAYCLANPRISVRTVDYLRDPGEAEKVKERYKLNAAGGKNLIIFERLPSQPSADVGAFKVAPGDALIQYGPDGVVKDKKLEFGPVAFRGEEMFTSMLIALENTKPFKAYFLQGHGEPALDDSGNFGYLKFAAVLRQNYIQVQPLQLLGDNVVPADCNLLIIAGPTEPLSELELQKISQYLKQGGRLLVLFNYASIRRPTGLKPILAQWGVNVGDDVVKDPNDTITGQDIKVQKFSQHPIVNALAQLSLQMILPRPVSRINWQNPPPDAPQVTELAFSGADSMLEENPGEPPRSYPLMVAVEQKPVAGVANPRGNTRMVVIGDSIFLGNYYIEGGENRDFLGYAVNWLLDRPQLLKGIGPRPITEFRLTMTQTQQLEVRWLLLGLLPGAVLLLGGFVWLARRK